MAEANDVILIVHDGSEYGYSGLRSLDDLGQLGNGHTRGFLGHNSLAVQAGNRRVLGLLNQILYRRPHVPKGETRPQTRARKDRESRLWQRACERLAQPRPDKGTSMSATAVPTYLNISSMSVSITDCLWCGPRTTGR